MQRIEITATKFYDRAVECFREKDYDNALKHINEAIKKYEKNPRFHYFYGFICQTIKDLHQAERSFLRCLDLDPKNDECLWNLSMIYFEEKKILEALKMWQLITDFKPEDLEARINTGLAYYQMSELAMAVQAFQAVLKIDPDNFEAHKNLALINKEQKNFEASMMHLARLPIIDSTYEEVVEKEMAAVESLKLRMSLEEMERQSYRGIIQDLRGGRGDGEGVQYESLIEEALSASILGDHQEALEKAGKALELNLKDTQPYQIIYQSNLALGNLEEAEVAIKKAIELEPARAELYNDLANLFLARGNKREALSRFLRVKELDPHFPMIMENIILTQERMKREGGGK